LTIVWLGEDGSDDPTRVGGKTAGLAPHARTHSVPPAFCLPVGTDAGPADIAAAYAELGRRAGRADPPVAVRSSAVDEDGSGASFAGVYETFLNLTGAGAVAEAVEHCRASAADPRVAEYRRQQGRRLRLPVVGDGAPDHTVMSRQAKSHEHGVEGGAAVAVLVQELVTADASAVVFTADPVTKDRERVLINAAWGLGEALVSGLVNPDTFLVAKAGGGRPGEILERRPARKEKMTVPVPGGTTTVGVPRALTSVPCLDDDAVLAAARLALELEDVLGHACDVECAWAEGRLYLLQCRPVTTL
jgi:pyruvate,water dikinase